jgi:hypothetical protein
MNAAMRENYTHATDFLMWQGQGQNINVPYQMEAPLNKSFQ